MKDRVKGWDMIPKFIHKEYDEPNLKYPKRLAIIDLIQMANIIDSGKYKRGCVYKSIVFLANRWHWNRRTVTNFLDDLQDEGIISYFSDKQGTIIKILNYGKWE